MVYGEKSNTDSLRNQYNIYVAAEVIVIALGICITFSNIWSIFNYETYTNKIILKQIQVIIYCTNISIIVYAYNIIYLILLSLKLIQKLYTYLTISSNIELLLT
jgi:hypothetical protein